MSSSVPPAQSPGKVQTGTAPWTVDCDDDEARDTAAPAERGDEAEGAERRAEECDRERRARDDVGA